MLHASNVRLCVPPLIPLNLRNNIDKIELGNTFLSKVPIYPHGIFMRRAAKSKNKPGIIRSQEKTEYHRAIRERIINLFL